MAANLALGGGGRQCQKSSVERGVNQESRANQFGTRLEA